MNTDLGALSNKGRKELAANMLTEHFRSLLGSHSRREAILYMLDVVEAANEIVRCALISWGEDALDKE